MGLTVLDAGVVIALLDGCDVHHDAAVEALRAARARGDQLVLPASAYAECLVGPNRRGPEAVAVVEGLVDTVPLRIEPATRAIAAEAAALRALHGSSLRLPDALVLATARILGAGGVITTDARWPDAAIGVQVLTP